MTNGIASEIIDLLAHDLGVHSEKIRLSDRLLQDLGMDGDDAVNFFISLQEQFGTDLTHLRERWAEHFGSEETSYWIALLPIPSLILAILVAGFTGSKVWGAGIAAALAFFVIIIWVMHRRRARGSMQPVTVSDVVDAAESGTWPEPTRS